MRFQLDHDYHIHSQLSLCSNDPEQNTQNILHIAENLGLRQIVLADHYWDERVRRKIIDFYDDRAEAMLDDIMPYILNKIAPIVIRYSSNRRKELEKLARQNAKRRRK